MEKELQIVLLEKLNIENLERVKFEAELNLDDLSNSEEIITNKSNTLFQILVVAFTTIIGYLVSRMNDFDIKEIIIQISIFLCLVFGIVLYMLIKILYPNRIALKGSSPNKLIQDYVFKKKSDKNQTKQILRNRVYSLNIAINNNKENLNKRVKLFDKANKTILFGLISVLIYSLVFFLTISCWISSLST